MPKQSVYDLQVQYENKHVFSMKGLTVQQQQKTCYKRLFITQTRVFQQEASQLRGWVGGGGITRVSQIILVKQVVCVYAVQAVDMFLTSALDGG